MIDEEYVSPEVIREWFIKEPNKPYYKLSVIEYYEKHGWLNFGDSTFEDRLTSVFNLKKDHYLGYERNIGAIDLEKPIVDGGNPLYISESELYHRDRFNKAMKSIKDVLIRNIVYETIILGRKIRFGDSNKREIRVLNRCMRKLLCSGLDSLVEFYGGKQFTKHKVVGFSNVRVI